MKQHRTHSVVKLCVGPLIDDKQLNGFLRLQVGQHNLACRQHLQFSFLLFWCFRRADKSRHFAYSHNFHPFCLRLQQQNAGCGSA